MQFTTPILLGLFLLMNACSTKEDPKIPDQQTIIQQPAVKDGAALLSEAKEKLAEAKRTLADEGELSCCIKDACDMCPLTHGSCDCYEDLKKGKEVCTECYAGWQEGKGTDPKIKRENVKT